MKRLQTIFVMMLCAVAVLAQERTITGIVTDGDFKGEPLMGATVTVGEGKVTKGTVTDMNGQFTLTVLASVKKVTVSYMGYESRTITLKPNQSKYDVTLYSSSKSLSEFVVTGYQQIDIL